MNHGQWSHNLIFNQKKQILQIALQGKVGKSMDLHRLDVGWRGKDQEFKLNKKQ